MTNFEESPEDKQKRILAELSTEGGMPREKMTAKLAEGGMKLGEEHVTQFGREGEQGKERLLSREEILAKVGSRCERPEVVRELADEHGPYLLEVREKGEDPNEATLYVYQRKGSFPGNNAALATVVEAVYFSGGDPCGGDVLAEYDSTTGEWAEKG